ncbi:MAG: 16S rRNA (guanine(527)-N(7))-methyltransferase RsmG [Enterobacteriaceae bacterium]
MGLSDKLNQLLLAAGITLSEQQKELLLGYIDLLNKWNKSYNLTAVRSPEQMLTRHLLDSIVVNPWLKGERFIDVGTGAGLPGIPLAIVRPEAQFTLLDSLGKRVRFLQQVKFELGLTNITPVQQRVEEFHPESGFDGVISRAFASLHDMVVWCRQLPASGGCYYALKGEPSDEELALLPEWIEVVTTVPLQVPHMEAQRCLVIMKNKQSTLLTR